ncbi:MAG: hypothetical protein GY820_08440, partial [Gammaproteobacteria bacterium]|nr:hypothetical protein [Gammaproteobacteria bacterium]
MNQMGAMQRQVDQLSAKVQTALTAPNISKRQAANEMANVGQSVGVEGQVVPPQNVLFEQIQSTQMAPLARERIETAIGGPTAIHEQADRGRSTTCPGQKLPPIEAYVGQQAAQNFTRNQQVFPTQMPAVIPSLPALSQFSGTRSSVQFSTFHKQFETQMRLNGVPRNQWHEWLPLYLSEEALELLHTLTDSANECPLSYDELIAELFAAFQKELAPAMYRQKFYAKHWRATNSNEEIDSYISELRWLACRGWSSVSRAQREQQIKEQLIAGLPKPLHDSVMLGGPKELRELLVILRGIHQHDEILEEEVTDNETVSKNYISSPSLSNSGAVPPQVMNRENVQWCENQMQQGVPSLKSQQQNTPSGMIMQQSDEILHIENDNPILNTKVKNTVLLMQGSPDLKSAQIPKREICLEGKSQVVMLDTGASLGLLAPRSCAYDLLGHRYTKAYIDEMITPVDDSKVITDCEGKAVRISGQTMVEVKYKEQSMKMPLT